MSEFKCQINIITVLPHPDPEVISIEIGKIANWNVVIQKGLYKSGDKVCYIPEQAILPDNMVEEMGLSGKLRGPKHNRVGPIKLRGVLSQGLIYTNDVIKNMNIGEDVKTLLNIIKYIPEIPVHMQGELDSMDMTLNFDIENIKKYPNAFIENEAIIVTEKIHGTFVAIGLAPEEYRKESMINGKYTVSSKGFIKGKYFKDNEVNKNNIYVLTVKNSNLFDKLDLISEKFNSKKVFITGEIYGGNIQGKYKYGTSVPKFKMFGIKIEDRFLSWNEIKSLNLGIEMVPILYEGPFSNSVINTYTGGSETVSGKTEHIREGIVIYPEKERCLEDGTRCALKSINESYLLKTTGEEIN